MSQYEYEQREAAKEKERKRKQAWEDYKNSEEWKKQKKKTLEQEKFQRESGWTK